MARKDKLTPLAGDTLLFAGWPDKTVDAGELGIIQFDVNGGAIVTQAQADWLAEQIAAGNLPELAASSEPLSEVENAIKTVAMCREAVVEGGPTTANVHPDEVENWKAGGWIIDQEQQGEGDDAKTTDSSTTAANDTPSTTVADGEAANGAASNTDEAGG